MSLVMWVIFLFSRKKQKTSQFALNNSLYFIIFVLIAMFYLQVQIKMKFVCDVFVL